MRYEVHFWRGCVAVFIWSALLGSAFLFALEGVRILGLALAFALVVLAGYAYGIQFLVQKLYYVELSAEGVTGSNTWCRRALVRWDAIASVGRYYVPPMGFVVVRPAGKASWLWLPTHVERQAEMLAELRRHAPVLHPLLRAYAA